MAMTSTGNQEIENVNFPGKVYYAASRAIFYTSNAMSSIVTDQEIKDLKIKVKDTAGASGKIETWGDDNLYPDNIVNTSRKNAIIPSIIDKFTRCIYGSGIITGIHDDSKNFIPKKFKEFEDFIKISDPLSYLVRASRDYLYFNQPLPEFILSQDRAKIVGLEAQHSAHVRWEKQDKNGKINFGYINAQWKDVSETDETTTPLPVVHQGFNIVGQIKALKSYNILYKYQVVSELEYYYPSVDWHSLFTSGWVDVANDIPQFKRFLMKNLATVNYIICVKDWYWKRRFKDWETLNPEEQITKRKSVYKELNQFITGIEMSGKSLLVDVWTSAPGYMEDPTHGESFTIKKVDSNDFTGKYNEDIQEANTMIMFAMGLDPSLFGSMPGTERSGGSDKREAYNIWITLIDLYADIILKPYEVIRDYNGWNPDMKFSFSHAILQTLDKLTQSQRQTTNQTQNPPKQNG